MRAVRGFLGLLLTIALLAAGCGGAPASTQSGAPARPESSTPAPSTSAPAAPAAPVQETVAVKLAMGGSKGSILYLPPVYADYGGYFKQQAIDIELLELKGGAQAQQALVSGEVDFATMAVEHAAKAQAQGVDLVMLFLFWRVPTVALVVDSKYQDQVKSVADLKGMKIGVTSPGSGSHKVLLDLLSKHGLGPSDVEIIGVGMPGMPEALATGKIQAASNYDPYITQVLSDKQAFLLWDTRTTKDTERLYGGNYPFVGLVTRRDVIEKKPDLVQRVVNSLAGANMSLTTSSPGNTASKLPAEVKGSDEALYVGALKANIEALSPDGMVAEQGLRIVIESLKREGVIPATANISPSMVFDGSFAQKAGR